MPNLIDALQQAIERHELFLTYQPIFDLHSKTMTSMEVCVCWEHPLLGRIAPVDFIQEAEKSGFIDRLGLWVIKTACEQLKLWQMNGFHHFTAAINISPHQLLQPELPELIARILFDCQIAPQRILFELTETIKIINNMQIDMAASPTQQILNKIRDLGIGIAIDDFGTGYSSLLYLSHLPITIIKIDQSFIKNIHERYHDEMIVLSIIQLGKKLGLTVIAEGIEQKEHFMHLVKNECPQGQGHYLSKPLTAKEMTVFLKQLQEKPAILGE